LINPTNVIAKAPLKSPFFFEVDQQYDKSGQEKNVIQDILQTGASFKKTKLQVNAGKNIYHHPQQNNGNCIGDSNQKNPSFILHSHI
jgi:hypothetical protein